MYQANTLLLSLSGKSVIEIKRNNGDGTYATVVFTSDPKGGLEFECAEFVTPEKKITSILNDILTFPKDHGIL